MDELAVNPDLDFKLLLSWCQQSFTLKLTKKL